jgi:putative flavoprotein involved in K+ transport
MQHTPEPSRDVVIIGAGPAGLSLAQQLKTHGVAALLLEAGASPGWSWTLMPDEIALISPWKANALPGTEIAPAQAYRQHPRAEFHAYLEDYARAHDLDVMTHARVRSVARSPGSGFTLELHDGRRVHATYVVNATGYFSNPHVPAWPGLEDTLIPWLHVHDYRSPAALAERIGARSGRILVVGKRVSSGQTLTELHDDPSTDFTVEVSSRGPITFARDPWLQRLAFRGFYEYEDLRVLLDPFFSSDSYPPMEGGRTRELIERGLVTTRPDVARFDDEAVVFADGQRVTYDAVVLATGFRPALEHLEDLTSPDPRHGLPVLKDMESPDAPGLFFLGLDGQRSIRSRYLRGIREDAAELARILERRLRTGPHSERVHDSVVDEVMESIRRVGLNATVGLAFGRLVDSLFDAVLGVDTSARVTLDALDIDADTVVQGQMYQPTGVLPFLSIMRQVGLPPEPVFVDYGSGKGRTLLLASLFPMRRVLGIEFSPELCETARANARVFSSRGLSKAPIDVECVDASRYSYAGDENVFYFFYPFDRDLMEAVVTNITASLVEAPRDALLVYYYPVHRDLFDDPSYGFALDQHLRFFGYECMVYRWTPTPRGHDDP